MELKNHEKMSLRNIENIENFLNCPAPLFGTSNLKFLFQMAHIIHTIEDGKKLFTLEMRRFHSWLVMVLCQLAELI